MGKQSKILTMAATILVTGAAIFSALVIINDDKPRTTTPAPAITESADQSTASEISYKGIEGKNALELLKQQHEVVTKEYSGMGEFVTGIDGRAAADKHFWSLYVNGQQSQVGASAYNTKTDDIITWKLEEIK